MVSERLYKSANNRRYFMSSCDDLEVNTIKYSVPITN